MNTLPVETNGSTIIATQDYNPALDFLPDSKLAALFKDSLSVARYKEYHQIIDKHQKINKDGSKYLNMSAFSKDDLDSMLTLFQSMSAEQQAVLELTFQRYPVPVERIPTNEQFESWKAPAQYGLWLNGKRTDNSELKRYQSSDFSHFSVSRLMRNAKDYGKYVYHLELETNMHFKERKAKAEADEKLYLWPNRQKR